MKKLVVLAFALILSAFVFGLPGRVSASPATTGAMVTAQAQVVKSEAAKVWYRRRYYRYYRHYHWKNCSRWHYIGRGLVRRWCRYY
jgi:hypothetical protein